MNELTELIKAAHRIVATAKKEGDDIIVYGPDFTVFIAALSAYALDKAEADAGILPEIGICPKCKTAPGMRNYQMRQLEGGIRETYELYCKCSIHTAQIIAYDARTAIKCWNKKVEESNT